MKVKVLLKDTVEGLGMIGDIVDVAPGYARNYIFPKKLGMEVNSGTVEAVEAAKKKRAELEAQRKLTLGELAGRLSACQLEISAKVSKAGSLYGAVGTTAVIKALAEQGIEVDEKMVRMPDQAIKSVGEFTISFHLHAEIDDPSCKLNVVAGEEVEVAEGEEADEDTATDENAVEIEED